MSYGAGTGPALIVFDLGGTWWRSAVVSSSGALVDHERHPAVTKAGTGSNVATLRELMVQFLLTHTRRLLELHPDVTDVGISVGAATNGHTGQILASAPLWGDNADPFDLRATLCENDSPVRWWVVNDVTGLALAIANRPEVRAMGAKTVAAVTVSSGIAARTIDVESGQVVLDRVHGMQGEIGHLPAIAAVPPSGDLAVCDCGAAGHVSAIASGKAIDRQLAQLAGVVGVDAGTDPPLARLRASLETNNPHAEAFLDSVTAPLARALLYLLAIDARIDHVFLSGGVVDTLADHYMSSVYRCLEAEGLYLVSTHQPTVFRDRISRLDSDGLDPLRGAGLFACTQSLSATARPGGRKH
ncbi:ROK family protein [Nocardia sp. NPDC058176]|uniref:ROK family protein n=1 Tax=Nocardia sp. NPDC058176 TaxID=3346368 RepID=UPI0036DF6A72